MRTKRTKALDIPKRVKDAVWARDGHRCVICASPYAMPNSHYIRRSKGGLGIEENIVTMCETCHRMYDQGSRAVRTNIGMFVARYLMSKYPNWNPQNLIYKKSEE